MKINTEMKFIYLVSVESRYDAQKDVLCITRYICN